MENDLLDSGLDARKKQPRTSIFRLSAAVIFILLILGLIAISFSVFQSPPSLGYLLIFYCAVAMAVLGIIVAVLLNGFRRTLSAVTVLGSSLVIILTLFIEENSEFVMVLGQFVTGVAFLANLVMMFIIALKKEKEV